MRIKRKPTLDELRQFIFDYGLGRAFRTYGLGEVSAINILYGRRPDLGRTANSPASNVNAKFFEVSELATQVIECINKGYTNLRKLFVDDPYTVDSYQALTDEDRFHEALLTTLQTLERFVFDNDNATYNYIAVRLMHQQRANRKTLNELRKKYRITQLNEETQIGNETDLATELDRKAKYAKYNLVVKNLMNKKTA